VGELLETAMRDNEDLLRHIFWIEMKTTKPARHRVNEAPMLVVKTPPIRHGGQMRRCYTTLLFAAHSITDVRLSHWRSEKVIKITLQQ
jgi:hypothetical protein